MTFLVPPSPPPFREDDDDDARRRWLLALSQWTDQVVITLVNYRARINEAILADSNGDISVANDATIGNDLTVTGDFCHNGSQIAFFGATKQSKPTVSGSAGSNAALESLLSALDDLGLIEDTTT